MLGHETATNVVAQGNPQNRFHIDGGLLELIIERPKVDDSVSIAWPSFTLS
jgi:hypothetical protein